MYGRPVPTCPLADTLIDSRQCCCLCFGLYKDVGRKAGRIMYLDHNLNNNSIENLAFLCRHHYAEYGYSDNPSKTILAHDVTRHRSMLLEYLAKSPKPPRNEDHETAFADRALGTDLIELRIGYSFEDYTDGQQEQLIKAIQQLLATKDKLRVISRRPGSVILLLQVSESDSKELCELARNERLLAFGVLDGRILEPTPMDVNKSIFVEMSTGADIALLNVQALDDVALLWEIDFLLRPGNLIVDFKKVKLINSTAFFVFTRILQHRKRSHGQVVFVNLMPFMLDGFQECYENQLFVTAKSLKAARALIAPN